MNLEEVIDPEYGLQQDEWSLRGDNGQPPRFGKESQLTVVGWSGRNSTRNKYYILFCNICAKDNELFGAGYFKSLKGTLALNRIPCACSGSYRWSEHQYGVRCSRKASEVGYKFMGFAETYKGAYTRIRMSCNIHGEWDTGKGVFLLSKGCGCVSCKYEAIGKNSSEKLTKTDGQWIIDFINTGQFQEGTKFEREEGEDYWLVYCPECGENVRSLSCNLSRGRIPCACSPQRQKIAYINKISDSSGELIAVKFGIAVDPAKRVKDQSLRCKFKVEKYLTFSFDLVELCKKAEKCCLKEMDCGVLTKEDMPDGWTETTSPENIEKIIEIYTMYGGTCDQSLF